MGTLPKGWIKWIGIIFGVAAMLTPALVDLGWIPASQVQNAVLFLLGLIVVAIFAGESRELAQLPELLTRSEDYHHAVTGFMGASRHEVLWLCAAMRSWWNRRSISLRERVQR